MNDLNDATLQWLKDLASQGVLTTDADLRIQGWNRWLENHTGYRADTVIGRNLFEVYPQLVERRMDQWYRQALNGQVTVLAQRLHRYLLPIPLSEQQSKLAWMQQSARIAPLTTEGRIIGTITVIDDVTEREVREAELRHQIAALEALHDVSSGILSLDLPQCLQRLVETTATLVRAPTVAVVLRHEDRLHVEIGIGGPSAEDTARVNVANGVARAVIRSGQPLFVPDLALRHGLAPLSPDSQCLVATPLIADSSVIGALIVESPEPNAFSPIDQRQVVMLATQAALGIRNAQIYREAQEAIRIRDTFLSIASHELKTPLTTILGNVQMLQRRNARENSLNERNKRTLDVVASQAARLNRMVAALLDISRIQTGQLSIEGVPMDLCVLAQRVVDDLQPTLDHHQIVLNLPDGSLIVEGDELRLEQVILNLLQNAVKYSPGGGTVEITVEQQDRFVCVKVSDQGIGIPESALPQLFGRFYRADNVRVQQISGMGVGLYVVKQIVDLHGGRLEVSSQEGVGSRFTICLPLAE